ncbi:triphosphoribosyl-dephospho-CoA synthase [Archaeoglobus veneficus]|uniref:Triphosphoribosyl-dephospho-CoA protein n=1 Tax=Archaeoglobus veneficus (strain DSM 11195 / SNP6) TaxID=693661 RepID=F2KMK9_ARCVS|nr:triphosphoribosyl-dephospho-CoA synthase [Archaeoglobus veneficus]AEA47206.1 triphosphoribosyl-dephospho-CoA protein [Archaeoglobus veneficus SNP6]
MSSDEGMVPSAATAATAAVLAMLLEVSATPKSGNVDREHSFEDLRYEHFLASSASSYPVFLRAAENRGSVGQLILDAVVETSRWHRAGNVHFGAFLLLTPLVYSWRAGRAESIAKAAVETLKNTTVEDSLAVLKAFRLSGARAMDVEELSLEDDSTAEELKRERINLYDWMLLAPRENIIARELTEGYTASLSGMKTLIETFEEFGDVNAAIVFTYHKLLSEYIDPLVVAKHGIETAKKVRDTARKVVEAFGGNIDVFKPLDEEFVRRRINPGTIADLTSSSIFLALIEGLRF